MARYTIEGMDAVLVTAAEDGSYRHPSGEVGTLNGMAVPFATYRELRAFSDAVIAAGERLVFRPMLIEDTLLLLHFPCEGGSCTATTSGDFVDLGNGEHAHHDESWEFEVKGEDDAVHVDGLIWALEEDDEDDEDDAASAEAVDSPAVDASVCEVEEDGDHVWVRDGAGRLEFDVFCSCCGQKGRATVVVGG